MAEPLYRHAHDHDLAAEAVPGQGVPGKMPVTARLSGRQQIVFRVESAEAARGLAGALGPRDDNGVAAGSEAAVDRAASSSGQALPGEVRDRFESSLGADLSGVRVHTGESSADAAGAVGARAYTVGQDIHFGAGQYDPSSAFGVHLLAHEVAHTVQQQGAAPTRQHKLEVSTPLDGAEREADQAADAMVVGQPAHVSSSFALSRLIHRDEITFGPEWYIKQAAAAEKDAAKSNLEATQANQVVLGATNVGDTAAAEAEVKKIQDQEESFQPALTSTFEDSGVAAAYADNHRSQDTLSAYIADAGVQTTSLNNFKIHYRRLMLDFERLGAMVNLSGISGDQTGDDFGAEVVKSQQLNAADKAAAVKDTDDPDANAAGPISTKKAELRTWEEAMKDKASHLGEKEKAITKAQYEYLAQCNNIASGLSPKKDPAAVTALKTLQAKVDEIKGYAKLIAGFAAKAVGGAIGGLATQGIDAVTGGVPSDLSHTATTTSIGSVSFDKNGMPMETTNGTIAIKETEKTKGQSYGAAIGDAAASQVPDIVGFIAGLPFAASINAATAAANAALESQVAAQKLEQLNGLEAKKLAIQIAGKAYIEDSAALERAKNQYRKILMEMAKAMDNTGGRKGKKFQTMAAFLGEAEAYLAQSKATRDIGRNELEQAGRTAEKRKAVTLATGADECRWWEISKKKNVASDHEHWELGKHEVKLPVGAKAKSAAGGAEDDAGANVAIQDELKRLDSSDAWVSKMRDRIKTEFNF